MISFHLQKKRILKNFFAVSATLGFLVACMPSEGVQTGSVSQRDFTLGTSSFSASECRRYFQRYGFQDSYVEVEVSGWSPQNPALGYIRELNYHLTRALVGAGSSSSVYNLLIEASSINAFTDPQPSNGGPSPAYMSAAILSSVAYAYDYLAALYDAQDLEAVRLWGNRLEDNVDLPFEAQMLDSRGAIASSRLAWGAASDQPRIFDAGLTELRRVLARALDNDMFFQSGDARMNTEVFNHVIAGATIARRNGVDVYSWQTRSGSTIHDLVAAQVGAALALGRTPVSVAETALMVPGAETTLMVMIPKGYGVHQAWVPMYLSQFASNDPTTSAASASRFNAEMQRVDGRPYYGENIGGALACYWG